MLPYWKVIDCEYPNWSVAVHVTSRGEATGWVKVYLTVPDARLGWNLSSITLFTVRLIVDIAADVCVLYARDIGTDVPTLE